MEYDSLENILNQYAQKAFYDSALEVLKNNKMNFPEKWFQISKEEIYLNEKQIEDYIETMQFLVQLTINQYNQYNNDEECSSNVSC